MSKNLKVLVSSKDCPESALKILQEHFIVLQTKYVNFGEEGRTKAKEEILNLIPGCSALVWLSSYPLSTEMLDMAGPELKIVCTASAGYNHCNVPELKARGIKLTNTPDVLSPAVADIAVSLMLATTRRFKENLQQIHSGDWAIGFDQYLGIEIRDSTVGIIGLGGIGQTIVKRLAGFQIKEFIYSGHREKPEAKALNVHFVTQSELLSRSDFVILAVPLTDETRLMMNQTTLRQMKKNAVLINIGRGDLVDQDALYDVLKSGEIYAAGLDVTTPEPLPKEHKLHTLDNCFILPHIGSATIRTRREMGELAANNVVRALHNQPLLTPVPL